MGGRLLSNNQVKLGGLDSFKDNLLDVNNIVLLGCGTSFFAGLYAIHTFKELCNFNIVNIIDGADFDIKDIPKIGKQPVFFSQSGETKDLHRCIDICKEHNIIKIGVINVPDSMIVERLIVVVI